MSKIDYIHRSLSQDAWKAEADRLMGFMFAEDVLPPERQLLTGVEDAVFAMFDEGDHRIVVGMAVYYQPDGIDDLLFLDLLYVEPAYRRTGIGSALISHVVGKAAEIGLPRVELGTLYDNLAMQHCARANGFGNGTVYFSRQLAVTGVAA